MTVNNVAVVFWFTTLCVVTDSQQPLQRKTIQACCNIKKVQITALQLKALQGADRHQTTRSHNQERQSMKQYESLLFEVRYNSTLIYNYVT